MFRLVVDIQLTDIGCCCWEKLRLHACCCILRMSVNGASTIFGFKFRVMCFLIGCRHPFIKYLQPLLAKTTATCSLPHPENERQRSVNSFSCCIFGIPSIALISAFITELLTAVIDKNTMYQRYNTDSKLIDITSCKACKYISLVVENAILIRYYSHVAKARALIQSMDGPAGWPADNRPNSDGLGFHHWTVPELTVGVYWKPRPPSSPWFGLDPDPDPKWRSGTIANPTQLYIYYYHDVLQWI